MFILLRVVGFLLIEGLGTSSLVARHAQIFVRRNRSDQLYRAILMSEFKLKMLPRVELKLSTIVRISCVIEVLFPNSVLNADLNPIWDEIIYIPGMSLLHPYTAITDLVSQCTP
jgi:hypothetical protein